MKTVVLALALTAALVSPALAGNDEGIVVSKGKLSNKQHNCCSVQLLSAKNDRAIMLGIGIECAFFAGDELLSVGGQFKSDVKPGETVYFDVGAEDAFNADRTVCRAMTGPSFDKNGEVIK